MSGSEEPSEGVTFRWDQRLEEEAPRRDIRLVVPAVLGDAVVLRGIVDAVDTTRMAFARLADFWACEVMADREKPTPNRARIAFGRGACSSYRAAHEHLDGELLGNLDLWLMYELQEIPGPAEIREAAERLCWRLDRPEVPLADGLPDAEMLVGLLRSQRDAFVLLALSMNRRALERDEGGVPGAGEYLGAARAMAQAADDLDWLLMRACGTASKLGDFLAAHGSWQERVIDLPERAED